jgi:hypothetical protein
MQQIDLQTNTHALPGTVEAYWYKGENPEDERTLFHRITIPLQEFNCDIANKRQPVSTEIVFDWYELGLGDIYDLHGQNLRLEDYAESEAFILIGDTHHWCEVKQLAFEKSGKDSFIVTGELVIEFENAEFAQNETFNFKTTVNVLRR